MLESLVILFCPVFDFETENAPILTENPCKQRPEKSTESQPLQVKWSVLTWGQCYLGLCGDICFRAAKAQNEGLFDAEIVPVKTLLKDKDGNEKTVVVCAS